MARRRLQLRCCAGGPRRAVDCHQQLFSATRGRRYRLSGHRAAGCATSQLCPADLSAYHGSPRSIRLLLCASIYACEHMLCVLLYTARFAICRVCAAPRPLTPPGVMNSRLAPRITSTAGSLAAARSPVPERWSVQAPGGPPHISAHVARLQALFRLRNRLLLRCLAEGEAADE